MLKKLLSAFIFLNILNASEVSDEDIQAQRSSTPLNTGHILQRTDDHYETAVNSFGQGAYNIAVQSFSRTLEALEKNFEIVLNGMHITAVKLLQAGQIELAIGYLEKLASYNYSPTLHTLGINAMQQNNFILAKEYFKKALLHSQPALKVDIARYLTRLGEKFYATNLEEAIKCFELAAINNNCCAFNNLGVLYLRQDNFLNAKNCFIAATELGCTKTTHHLLHLAKKFEETRMPQDTDACLKALAWQKDNHHLLILTRLEIVAKRLEERKDAKTPVQLKNSGQKRITTV